MAKLTSFSDFINGETPNYNTPKPYIYVIKYILSKEDYIDELKEYILNYRDEESDYEDDNAYDPFMHKLKEFAQEDAIDEIEDMIASYDEFEYDDFDEEDDDFEERMYNKEYVKDDEDILPPESQEDLYEEIEMSNLSDKLKDFLKIDLDFEDLDEETENDDFDYELNEQELENAEDIDYEEIVDEALDDQNENFKDFDLEEQEEQEEKED